MGIVFMPSYLWERQFSFARPFLASVRQFVYGSAYETVIFEHELAYERACVDVSACAPAAICLISTNIL